MATATENRPLTKTQLLTQIADQTGLNKRQVGEVFDALVNVVQSEVGGRKGAGALTIPGLVKIVRVRKPAVKAQKNVKNPFTGELQDRPAKPARNVVKVRPLKGLKDMV